MTIKLWMVALAAVVIGGGWWALSSGDDAEPSANQSAQTEASTLNQLIAGGDDLTCSFSDTDADGNINTGQVYLSDGRMSGEFTLAENGANPIKSYLINDGSHQYSWQDGETEGFKLSLDHSDDGEVSEAPTQQPQPETAVDQDQSFDFDCQGWTVDESRFTPPANVNFVDFSDFLNEATEGAAGAAEQACAQISDAAARAACESNL